MKTCCKTTIKPTSAALFRPGTELDRLSNESSNINLSYKERSEAFKKVIERVKSNPEEAVLINVNEIDQQ